MGIWKIHRKHCSGLLYSCCPCIPPRAFQCAICFVQIWRGSSKMSHHGPRHLGHSKSWIYAVGNEPPAKGDCKSEKGWQFLRCFIGAQGAASLSLEAGFQYTDTGKLSLARVLSETKLSQLATGFRGLGQRRSYRKAPKGAKQIAHIYVVLMVSLQRKVHLRNKLWFSWEQSRRRAAGGVISHNLKQHVSQYSKQVPDKPPACNYGAVWLPLTTRFSLSTVMPAHMVI